MGPGFAILARDGSRPEPGSGIMLGPTRGARGRSTPMPHLARHSLPLLALLASGCAVLRPGAPPPTDSSGAERFSVRDLIEGEEEPTEEPGRETSSPTDAGPLAEAPEPAKPAPNGSDSIVLGLPEVPPEAVDAAAGSARPEEAEPKRLVRGSSLLGRAAEDHVRVRAGSVRDFLVDPASGAVAAVLTGPGAGVEGDWIRVLLYDSLKWEGGGSAKVIVSASESGAARRDLVADLFDVQEPVRIVGEVLDVEQHGPGYLDSAVVMVRDADNLHHRLALGPASLTLPALPTLGKGDAITAEGVVTRDSRGRLVIVSSLVHTDATLTLRDERGQMNWNELTSRLLSARRAIGGSLATSGAEAVPIADWLCDWRRGRVTHLLVKVGEAERAVPWERLRPGVEGWSTVLGLDSIEELPVFVEDE